MFAMVLFVNVPVEGKPKNRWILGARPRTLPAAVVPVAVGTAVAGAQGEVLAGRALLALVVSLALQVGVNYANDYSDGVRGTDDARVGPIRLVASGLASPRSVKRAAIAAFITACGAGLVLALLTSLWLIVVGVVAVLAAWFYTGGRRPYGYAGFGELFVFVFFGVVAVVGTAYVQLEDLSTLAFAVAVPVGFLATALLVVNNLRDIPGDTVAKKHTLAVRLGDTRTRALYGALIVASYLCLPVVAFADGSHAEVLAAFASVPLAVRPIQAVLGGAAGRALLPVLGATGQLHLAFGVLMSLGLLLR